MILHILYSLSCDSLTVPAHAGLVPFLDVSDTDNPPTNEEFRQEASSTLVNAADFDLKWVIGDSFEFKSILERESFVLEYSGELMKMQE